MPNLCPRTTAYVDIGWYHKFVWNHWNEAYWQRTGGENNGFLFFFIMDSDFFLFLLNSSHAEILKVPTWFYSFASGTYCHWSWSQLCCLILGFTEYRKKDWAKAVSSCVNGVRPWSWFLALCSSPSAQATEGSLSLTGSASFAVRLVFYTQAGGSPLLPQCSLGWQLQRSVPGVWEGALFPCVLRCSPLGLRGELWLL